MWLHVAAALLSIPPESALRGSSDAAANESAERASVGAGRIETSQMALSEPSRVSASGSGCTPPGLTTWHSPLLGPKRAACVPEIPFGLESGFGLGLGLE